MQNLITAGASPVRASSPLHAEFLVAAAGLAEAKDKGMSNFILLTDLVSVYLQLSGISTPSKDMEDLIHSCKEYLTSANGSVKWTFREYLFAPDSLAKLAKSNAVSITIGLPNSLTGSLS